MKAIDVLEGVMRRQRETAGTDLADSAAPLEARLKWARENDRASYDYFIRYGVFPRKPRRVVKPDGPGALAQDRHGRPTTGLSVEAVQLFDAAQRRGGSLAFRELRRAHAGVLQRLVDDELAPYGLACGVVIGGRPGMEITQAYRGGDVMLVSGGWRRFENGLS